MGGFESQQKINLIEAEGNGETRKEKIENAERSVFDDFNKKLAGILERIGENPYFRDLEQTV